MNPTNIEYLDFTWSPIAMRCTPVSEGCAHCWHIQMCDRLKNNPKINQVERDCYAGETYPCLIHERLEAPLKRKKPAIIGVQFMGDLFHDDVPFHMVDRILAEIQKATQHTFLILTKRPTRMSFHLSDQMLPGRITPDHLHQIQWPLPNLCLGVSVENQKRVDERIPILLQIPAAKRFVSVEPMLGPVDLDNYLWGIDVHSTDNLNWVVCGCESGPRRRPAEVQWFRDLKNQCVEAQVPFFLKQRQVVGADFIAKIKKMPCLDGKIWEQRP